MLTINGQYFPKSKLKALCRTKLNSDCEVWEKSIYGFIETWLEKDEISFKTSGSTGTPKTIIFNKIQLTAAANATAQYFKLQQGDSILLCLSADYIAGKMVIVRALVLGLNLIIVKPSSNPLESLSRTNIAFAAMVPLQVSTVLKTNKSLFNSVNSLLIGGSVVHDELLAQLTELNCKVFVSYGMTETLGHIAIKRLQRNSKSDYFEALPQVELETSKDGCLIVSVDYLGIHQLKTNDVIELITPKRFKFLGRADNVINSGGIKLFPEQLEKIMELVITERRFFVFGNQDEVLGESVELVIEGQAYNEQRLVELSTYFKKHLPKFSMPKKIHFVQEFLFTDSGKIQRHNTITQYQLKSKE